MKLEFEQSISQVNESYELDNFLRDSKASLKDGGSSLYSQASSLQDRRTLAILRMANNNTV